MIGNIRQKISKNADALKEGGAAALGTLILGGSKAEAAMAGVGQTILTKLIGPLGKLVGITAIATKGIYNMTKAWATMGTGAAAKLETVQNQLRVMLKGLDAAKQRVRELRNFSIVTPFKLPDIVAGNRALESLTKGALVTREAMTMVGDAASQAGVDFNDMAVYVARLYDGLAGGRPVGEVLFRLAELGVISGQARTSLEKLQESGAGFGDVWKTVEGELKRFQGTMAFTSQTLEGLQSTLEDTQDEVKAAFSENFIEGQKEAVKAYTKTLENIKPAVVGISDAFSGFVTVTSTLSARFTAWVTGLPGVSTALEFLARAAALAMVALTSLAVATGAARLVGGLSALAAGAGLGGRALLGLATAARLTGMALAALAVPLTALVAVVALVVGAVTLYTGKVKRLEQAQREYAGATDAMLDKLRAQAAAIKTLDQLSANYASTLDALSQAYRDSAQASADLQEARSNDGFLEKRGVVEMADARDARVRKQQAEARIGQLKGRLSQNDQVDRGTLERGSLFVETMKNLRGNERGEEEARRQAARQTMTPAERAASLQQEADQMAARRNAAVREIGGTEAYRKQAEGVNSALQKNRSAQVEGESARQAALSGVNPGASYEDYERAAAALARLKDEEVELMQQELKLAEAQGSEIVKLQAKIAAYSRYEMQQQGVYAVEVKLRELQKEPVDEKTDDRVERLAKVKEATAELAREQEALNQLMRAGAGNTTPAQAQEMASELERRKQEASADILNRPDEIAKRAEAAAAQREVVKGRLEYQGAAREQMAGETGMQAQNVGGLHQMVNVGGDYARASEQLTTEKARLFLQKEGKEISEEEYRLRMAVVASEQRLLDRERSKKNEAAAGDLAEAQAGEDRGALAGAQEQLNQEKQRLDLAHQRGEIETSIYELSLKKLAVSQQELERRKAQAVGENAADMKAGGLNLQAQAERLRGRGGKARELEEKARRGQEDAGIAGRTRELMDSTGMAEADAKKQAQQEVERARLGRGMDQQGGLLQSLLGKGQVVDGLQRIGGGGGVGRGPDLKQVVDRLDKLIRAVENQEGGDIRL